MWLAEQLPLRILLVPPLSLRMQCLLIDGVEANRAKACVAAPRQDGLAKSSDKSCGTWIDFPVFNEIASIWEPKTMECKISDQIKSIEELWLSNVNEYDIQNIFLWLEVLSFAGLELENWADLHVWVEEHLGRLRRTFFVRSFKKPYL